MQSIRLYFSAALCALLLLVFTGCTASDLMEDETAGTSADKTHTTSQPTAEDGDLTDDLFS